MAGNRTCVRFSIKCVTHVTQSWVSCVTEMWIPRLSLQRATCCHVRKQMQQQQHSDNFEACLLHKVSQYQVHLHTAHQVECGVGCLVSKVPINARSSRNGADAGHGVGVEVWSRSLYAPLTCKSNSKQVELGTVYTIWGPKTPRTDITKFVVWQKAKQAI